MCLAPQRTQPLPARVSCTPDNAAPTRRRARGAPPPVAALPATPGATWKPRLRGLPFGPGEAWLTSDNSRWARAQLNERHSSFPATATAATSRRAMPHRHAPGMRFQCHYSSCSSELKCSDGEILRTCGTRQSRIAAGWVGRAGVHYTERLSH